MHRRGLAINHRRPTLSRQGIRPPARSLLAPLFVWSLFGRRGRDVGGGISRSVHVRPSSSSASVPVDELFLSLRSPSESRVYPAEGGKRHTQLRNEVRYHSQPQHRGRRGASFSRRLKQRTMERKFGSKQLKQSWFLPPLWTRRGRPTMQGG